jgi:D-alanyl-D-alanine carboxypeptidase
MIRMAKYLLLLLLVCSTHGLRAQWAGADSMAAFIAANKSRASVYVLKDDAIVCRQNEDLPMPLASTVKILVAIEFAKQCGSNVLDENQWIPIKDLDKFYLPLTDGDAHPNWLNYAKTKKQIVNDSVQLMNVAKGMIMFSSNANTEYLMSLTGFDNVKSNISLFGLKNHTAVFPVVSSLFIFQNPKKMKEDKIIKAINTLTEEQYCKTTFGIHKALANDTLLKSKFRPQDLTLPMQKVWSDRLTAAPAKTYALLCNTLNRRKFLDENTYGILTEILEFILESEQNRKIYKQFGFKNGSTNWVLTEAFYATLQTGEKIEAAYFFNNLTADEQTKLQDWMNDFRIGLTQQSAFREKLGYTIGK